MNNISRNRIKWIDSLKGFTIFLVVLQHVIAGFEKAGILYNGVIEINLYKGIGVFHMPLFMAVSGYVFALAYMDKKDISRKARGGLKQIELIHITNRYVICLFCIFFSHY